jgi:hypothetical protein
MQHSAQIFMLLLYICFHGRTSQIYFAPKRKFNSINLNSRFVWHFAGLSRENFIISILFSSFCVVNNYLEFLLDAFCHSLFMRMLDSSPNRDEFVAVIKNR